jgi:tellurite methyltransferase
MDTKPRWETRYSKSGVSADLTPSCYLVENQGLVPHRGLALDVASGTGRNSIFLAQLGLDVIALDISETALVLCGQHAVKAGVTVSRAVVDLSTFQIAPDTFDLIINFNYLQRDLAAVLVEGLKVGGVLVFETMTRDHLQENPDFTPDFLLKPGELLRLFRGLHLLKYREADIPGRSGMRSVASIFAIKDAAPVG